MSQIPIGAPYLLQFNLLTDCIFQCPYCYLDDIRSGGNKLISAERYEKFMISMNKYYLEYGLTFQVNLTGGDIWLHSEIERILKFTLDLPYVSNIGLMLNNLWHKQSKEWLLLTMKKISLVQLNIDAMVNRQDDLDFLYENNIRTSIKIMISNDKKYFNHQIEILKILKKSNSNLLVAIDRLCPTSFSQLKNQPSREEMKSLINIVINESGGNIITDDPFVKAMFGREKDNDYEVKGCSIPNGAVTIYPNGEIKLCARLPKFNTGYDIESFDLEKYIAKYYSMMKKHKKGCKDCKLFSICDGGCPATSFIESKEKISVDYNCVKYGK